jgi:anti-sigma B factor antagonist
MIDIRMSTMPTGVIRLAVNGEIDLATADRLDAALAANLVRAGITGMEIDFAGVSYCDSTGIAVLDRAYGVATDRGVKLRVTNVQPGVSRVLHLVGLLEILTGRQTP